MVGGSFFEIPAASASAFLARRLVKPGLHIRLPVLLEVPIRHHIVVLHHPVAPASVATQNLNQGSGYQAGKRTTMWCRMGTSRRTGSLM